MKSFRETYLFECFHEMEGVNYTTAVRWAAVLVEQDLQSVGQVVDLSKEDMAMLLHKDSVSALLKNALNDIRQRAEGEIEQAGSGDGLRVQHVCRGEKWKCTNPECERQYTVCVSNSGPITGEFQCHWCLKFSGFKECRCRCWFKPDKDQEWQSLCVSCQNGNLSV